MPFFIMSMEWNLLKILWNYAVIPGWSILNGTGIA